MANAHNEQPTNNFGVALLHIMAEIQIQFLFNEVNTTSSWFCHQTHLENPIHLLHQAHW